MYVLTFKKNKSKFFPEALAFAEELGGTLKNGIVTIEIKDVLNAYMQIRSLFSFIQNWKGTTATYNGKPVHPYQFLLHAHWVGDCFEDREIDKDCGGGWSCMKIDNLRYNIPDRPYKSHKYWYRYGHFQDAKWIINKKKIYQVLLKYAEEKAITLCPFFDETKLQAAVNGLPDFIIPDNKTFATTYQERYAEGEKIQVPDNILHLGYLSTKHVNG